MRTLNRKEYSAKYYQKNRKRILECNKRYCQNNKERITKQRKQFYQNNIEKEHERQRLKYNKYKFRYYQKYKKEIHEDRKLYYQNNREKLIEQAKKYNNSHKKETNERNRRRRKNNPKFRLNYIINKAIYKTLKTRNISKNNRHWESLVNFTLKELITHLENLLQGGMTWKNKGKWHIDHIKPISLFEFKSIDDPEFKECWSLSNLQPLWAKDNLQKSNKYKIKE